MPIWDVLPSIGEAKGCKRMINEWNEFYQCTHFPVYAVKRKKDLSYLGGFLFSMLDDLTGFTRVFTILARGFLFHNPETGALLSGDPYARVEFARNALLAWCSIPDPKPDNENPLMVCFPELSAEFPALVNEQGEGWLIRHVRNINEFVRTHANEIGKRDPDTFARIAEQFPKKWADKVRQFQIPIFAVNTEQPWSIRFDDMIAAALDAGPLRTEDAPLPDEYAKRIAETDLNGVKPEVIAEVMRFILANRQPDSAWVVFPAINFGAYLKNETFSKKTRYAIPSSLIQFESDATKILRARIAELETE